MGMKYSETRYAQRDRWMRRPPEEKREEEEVKKERGTVVGNFWTREGYSRPNGTVGERKREPPGPASEALPEVLDLGHYGYTNIFTHFEMGWHFEKSVSYDAMYERRVEKARLRAEINQMFSSEERLVLMKKSLVGGKSKEGRQRERDRKERDRRMNEGRAHSDDEDDLYSKRRGAYNRIAKRHEDTYEDDLDYLDAALGPPPAAPSQPEEEPRTRIIELPVGPLPRRPNIKGEKLYLPEDKSEMVLQWTDLMGFPMRMKFACFYMSGEMHIVLPQLMMELSMGYGFGHEEMNKKEKKVENKKWDYFNNIFNGLKIIDKMKKASLAQVEVLKRNKIVNNLEVAKANGTRKTVEVELMRKSDVSRLLGEYLPLEEDENDNIQIGRISQEMEEESLEVEHGCQGYASGRMYSTGYIRCADCQSVFKPDAFICHSHFRNETDRVTHWGFDPRKWRNYVNLTGKDRADPQKIKRFNFIISEPLCVQFRSKTKTPLGQSQTILVPLNKNYNRHPPSPFEVGAESAHRIAQKRTVEGEEEDYAVEEEENIEKTPLKNKLFPETIDDEVQIVGETFTKPKFVKDDFQFKVPDPFATARSRKYTEEAFKTKGIDLDELTRNLTQHPLQKLFAQIQQHHLLPQTASVFAASSDLSSGIQSFKSFDLLNAFLPSKEKKIEDDSFDLPFNKSKVSPPPLALPPPTLPPTSTAVVPYQSEQHSVVPFSSSSSAFLPVSPETQRWKDVERSARRQQMLNQNDAGLQEKLQQIPDPTLRNQLAELIGQRDVMHNEKVMEQQEEIQKQDKQNFNMKGQVRVSTKDADFLFITCKHNGIEVANMPPPAPLTPPPPRVFTPIRQPFALLPPSTPSLPSSSQPLALLPPPHSSAPSTPSRPSPLNGGRSLSLSSPIGIRPVPASLLGQPGPSNVMGRPMQQPQRVVGQRGRPRGSGGPGYQQRKLSQQQGAQAAAAVQHAANTKEVEMLQRQIMYERQMEEQRKMQQQQHNQQQQQHLNQLRQMQQLQQLQQHMHIVPQPTPMGLINGASLNGSPSNLHFIPQTSTSLASLLPTTQPMQQLQLQQDFNGFRLSDTDTAAFLARVQLDSSMAASSSGLSTPLAAATPTNGLLPSTPTQDGAILLNPQTIQQLLQQSTSLEQQAQRQQQLLQPDQSSVVQQVAAIPSMQPMNGGVDMFRLLMQSQSLPEGITFEQLLAANSQS